MEIYVCEKMFSKRGGGRASAANTPATKNWLFSWTGSTRSWRPTPSCGGGTRLSGISLTKIWGKTYFPQTGISQRDQWSAVQIQRTRVRIPERSKLSFFFAYFNKDIFALFRNKWIGFIFHNLNFSIILTKCHSLYKTLKVLDLIITLNLTSKTNLYTSDRDNKNLSPL